MKDAVATMGGLLPEDAGGRDAVHVAVFSAISEEKLFPGQDVAISEIGERDARVASNGDLIGIVDPFLEKPVFPGQRCWVYLYPRTITALNHRWSHPAFAADNGVYFTPSNKIGSENWLRDFCAHNDCPSYTQTLALAENFINGYTEDDEYLLVRGQDAHGEIPAEFWVNVGIVLGRPIPPKCPTYFTCSC